MSEAGTKDPATVVARTVPVLAQFPSCFVDEAVASVAQADKPCEWK